ncbi:TRAP transporter substrate-binding protein [Xylophilus sp. GOD-11R]|uniref:TRAP transporter substrate-binding protein n=1 Tax=Xylophilus sp. GOD-11R TaxID=3089814 RepID=UPI00298C9D54|nr:TRAP transporter substrate-binding protein [Xylophilus sp. GOD-11R]WPB58263.1 TRAP transporter substrate-binding protein [Xylophilus sp. GOD-11R]
MTLSRRHLLKTAPLLASTGSLAWLPAHAARTTLKFGSVTAVDHPVTLGAKEAAATLKEATGGDVDLRVFPNSQLGSDMDMLSQVRAGALDMVAISSIVLSNLVPSTSVTGVGFAWSGYDKVWAAMDGELGRQLQADIEAKGLHCVGRIWDMGFRQITSSEKRIASPDDLKGFKIRIPPAEIWVSLFQSLGASPANISWAETYSALQTRVADGQENPLTPIFFSKMYEVQKYVAMSNHMWDGMWIIVNKSRWEKMDPKTRAAIEKAVDQAGVSQRANSERLNQSLRADLTAKGMQFVDVKSSDFRDRLSAAGFYKKAQGNYRPDLWAAMEKYTGKLA